MLTKASPIGPYSEWPRILILDDDVGRIELLQQRGQYRVGRDG
jgi:hypothetical protein